MDIYMGKTLDTALYLGYNTRMKLTSISDVSPELASDIQYLWDETNLTSEEIAVMALQRDDYLLPRKSVAWLEIVWDILGGAYNYEDHQN